MSVKEIERIIKKPSCVVHYWLSGNPDNQLIFLAHGAAVDHSQFDLQIPCLMEDYQILRWDMRGHGKSRPLDGPFSVKDAVDDVASMLDSLGKEEAIFMGQSAGTYVIQEMAFQHPERVNAMIIIDGTCITAKLSMVESVVLRNLSPLMFRLWPYENLKKTGIDASSVNYSTKQYLKDRFDSLSKDDFVKIWGGVSKCIHYEPDYHVRCPLLLVYGEYDKTGNIRKAMKEWAERDKQSRYVVIPDAGHCSNQDNYEFFNKVMMEFLEGLEV
ncbi:MAG TPA: alpha/beta hydrolase [Candidatus Acidoferrales bacterium]|nr:alpha/beta hydrolase [Candidatus Acidoferrales bacterium]